MMKKQRWYIGVDPGYASALAIVVIGEKGEIIQKSSISVPRVKNVKNVYEEIIKKIIVQLQKIIQLKGNKIEIHAAIEDQFCGLQISRKTILTLAHIAGMMYAAITILLGGQCVYVLPQTWRSVEGIRGPLTSVDVARMVDPKQTWSTHEADAYCIADWLRRCTAANELMRDDISP